MEMEFLLLGLIFLLSTLFLLWKYQKSSGQKSASNLTVPGPARTHPTKGNWPDINKAGSLNVYLRNLHEQYGPIISFWDGPKQAVSLATPELLKTQRQFSELAAGQNEPFRKYLGSENLAFIPAEEVLMRRKQYDPFFASKACNTFYHCFHEIAQEVILTWSEFSPDTQMSLKESLTNATSKAILRTSFGEFFKDDNELQWFRKTTEEVMALIQQYPALPEEDEKRMIKIGEEQMAVVRHVVETRKKTKEKQEGDDVFFIDLLIDDDSISDTYRIAESIVFLVAGYITTAYAMTHLLYFLSVHQNVQEKVYKEIKEVLGEAEHVDSVSLPKLIYLRQVIDETMRCIPLVEYTGREIPNDMELGGHLVPKGTNVYQNLAVIAMDPNIFPNPERFDPDRFSKENSKGRSPFAHKPFGFAGKRQCPGLAFSLIEMSVFITEFIKHFRFDAVPGQKAEISIGPINHIANDVKVILTKRNM